MCGTKLENFEQVTAQPEKKAPKINKKIVIGAAIAVCLIGVVIGISEYNAQPSTKYKKAEAAFASGEWEAIS